MGCGGSKSTAAAVPPPPKQTTNKPPTQKTGTQKPNRPAHAEVKRDTVDIKLVSQSSLPPKTDEGTVVLDASPKDESLITDIIKIESSMRSLHELNEEAREVEEAKILEMQMSVSEAASEHAIHEQLAEAAIEEVVALEEERASILLEEEDTKARLQAADEEVLRLQEIQRQEDEAKQRELEASIAAAQAEAAEAARKLEEEELIRQQIEEEQRLALEKALAEKEAEERAAAEEAERLAQLELEIQRAKEEEAARVAAEEALKLQEQRKLEELREEEARQRAAEQAEREKADEARRAALAAKRAEEQKIALEQKKAADKALIEKMNQANSKASTSSRVLILYSSLSSDAMQVMNQRRMDDLIMSYKYDYIRIDGASAENKDIRSKLFEVSQQRGKYPQCFVQTGDQYEFIGLWDQMESLADCESLPADVLAANPNIPTLSRVFKNVPKV